MIPTAPSTSLSFTELGNHIRKRYTHKRRARDNAPFDNEARKHYADLPRSGMPLPVRTLTFTLPVDVNPGDKLTFSVAHAHFRERRRAA